MKIKRLDLLALAVLQSNYDYKHTGLPQLDDAQWDKACIELSNNWDKLPLKLQDLLGDKDTIRYTGSGMKYWSK